MSAPMVKALSSVFVAPLMLWRACVGGLLKSAEFRQYLAAGWAERQVQIFRRQRLDDLGLPASKPGYTRVA